MTLQRWLVLAAASVPLIPLLALIAMAVLLVRPQADAHACLPCTCNHVQSLNCYGPYLAFAEGEEDACSIEVFRVGADGSITQVIDLTPQQFDRIPRNLERNWLLKRNGEFALYYLTNGEFQLNVGPDFERKVHTLNFTACPADNTREGTFLVQ